MAGNVQNFFWMTFVMMLFIHHFPVILNELFILLHIVKLKEGDVHREKKEKSVKPVKIKVEEEDEDEQQHGPSQNVGWMKDSSDGLKPCVNSFQDHLSPVIKSETFHNIKIEEYTEDELPLVGG
jgi:hypothetical protein